MSTPLIYPPTLNGLQKQLNADLNVGVTASATLTNTTGIQNKPGVMLINHLDTAGNVLPAAGWEFVMFTGTSGNTVTGLTRGLGGTTDQQHYTGEVVEFVFDVTAMQAIIDSLANLVDTTTLALDTTKIQTPLSKAAGSDVTAGTDDAKYLTAKAAADAGINLATGYIADTDTWVYVSASSFKITGKDVTARFPKGTRIKLTQTTAKYFYVLSAAFSTDTTVTITGGSDYTLANAAITSPLYSYASNPQGFPQVFNTGTITFDTTSVDNGTGSQQPTVTKSYFTISGGMCTHWLQLNVAVKNGASNAISFTLPATMPAINSTAIDPTNGPNLGVGHFGTVYYMARVATWTSLTSITIIKFDAGTITDNTNIGGTSASYSYPI